MTIAPPAPSTPPARVRATDRCPGCKRPTYVPLDPLCGPCVDVLTEHAPATLTRYREAHSGGSVVARLSAQDAVRLEVLYAVGTSHVVAPVHEPF